MLAQNTITHALSILTRFDIKFLKNAWEFNHGVTQRNELINKELFYIVFQKSPYYE